MNELDKLMERQKVLGIILERVTCRHVGRDGWHAAATYRTPKDHPQGKFQYKVCGDDPVCSAALAKALREHDPMAADVGRKLRPPKVD